MPRRGEERGASGGDEGNGKATENRCPECKYGCRTPWFLSRRIRRVLRGTIQAVGTEGTAPNLEDRWRPEVRGGSALRCVGFRRLWLWRKD